MVNHLVYRVIKRLMFLRDLRVRGLIEVFMKLLMMTVPTTMPTMMLTMMLTIISTVILTITLTPNTSSAQAYCALRQPHQAQQALFPNSTSLETFTDQVKQGHRDKIQRELNFTIHKDELGLHTLYAVFRGQGSGREHLGYIHVRSEQGEWGLIEIAWALYPDLTVKNFIFQRCREDARDELEEQAFKFFIHKKTSQALRKLLNQDGSELVKPLPSLSEDAQELGLSVIRSALKTIIVTRSVWPKVSSP